MKYTRVLGAFAVSAALVAPAIAGAQTSTVPAGTQFNATLQTTLDTRTSHAGDPFTMVVQNSDNPALNGATISGHVVKVQAAGSGKPAAMALGFDTITPVGGQPVPLNAKLVSLQEQKNNQNIGRQVASIAGGVIAGNILGGWLGAKRAGGIAGLAGGLILAGNQKDNVHSNAGAQASVQLQSQLQLGLPQAPQPRYT